MVTVSIQDTGPSHIPEVRMASSQPKHRVGFFNRLLLFVLLTYIGAIIFLPRVGGNFPYGANLRYEDLLTPLLVLLAFTVLGKNLSRGSVLLGGLYFVYTLGITLLNIAFGTLPLEAIIIYGKELQFFLGFLIMLSVAQKYAYMKWVKRTLFLGILFACATGVWLAVTGQVGYYGITYITETNSPSLSALMYFNLIVLAFYLQLDSPSRVFRWCMLGFSLLSFGLLSVVGSRMGFIMGVTFFLVLWVLYSRRPVLLLLFLGTLAVGVVGIYLSGLHYFGEQLAFFDFENPVLRGSISRLGTMFVNDTVLTNSRFDAWGHLYELATVNAQGVIFGCGRGCGNVYLGNVYGGFPLGLSGDSQYMVMFLESGLIGIGLFAAALFHLMRGVRPEYKKVYLSYLVAYLVGGVFAEVFLLSKGGGLFWLISAMVIGSQCIKRDTRISSG